MRRQFRQRLLKEFRAGRTEHVDWAMRGERGRGGGRARKEKKTEGAKETKREDQVGREQREPKEHMAEMVGLPRGGEGWRGLQ